MQYARPVVGTLICFLIISATSAASAAETRYTVRSGDMLGSIAQRHGVTVQQLRDWNNLRGDFIREGQTLIIRGGSGASGGGDLLRPPPRVRDGRVHVVRSGEVLGAIASRYSVTIADLIRWNAGLNPDRIRVGQEIRIGLSGARGPTRRITVEVQPGEVLGAIARRHGVTVAEIQTWNNGLNPDRIRVGQRLTLHISGPENPSESVGAAFEGTLRHGEQLPPHRGYEIRDRNRAWGTNNTITFIMEGYDAILRRFPHAPRIMVHDISLQRGGQIPPHRSHQSGRDADIGYYYRNCDPTCVYRAISAHELDSAKQWTLFSFWIENEMVEYIFMDYALQGALHAWLKEQGASDAQLGRWLQYPHGQGSRRGLIRHEPGHATHFHARFSCSDEDPRCR